MRRCDNCGAPHGMHPHGEPALIDRCVYCRAPYQDAAHPLKWLVQCNANVAYSNVAISNDVGEVIVYRGQPPVLVGG